MAAAFYFSLFIAEKVSGESYFWVVEEGLFRNSFLSLWLSAKLLHSFRVVGA